MSKIFTRFRIYIKKAFALEKSPENTQHAIDVILKGIEIKGVNLWVLVLAIFIASLGLNTNSTAVIIGAMLVSPLMGPIMGIGTGLAINNDSLVYSALRHFLVAVGISIATSTLYFLISPVKEAGSELIARTSPTIYDVLIAIAGGLAGIIAGSSRLKDSNVIPGVAIATALMPPLCTVGYGIATLQLPFIIGAFYLFFINTVFISASTYVIVKILQYSGYSHGDLSSKKAVRWSLWLLVVIAIVPSIYVTYHIIRKSVFEKRTELFMKKEVENSGHWVVAKNVEYNNGKQPKIELIVLSQDTSDTWEKLLVQKLDNYKLNGTKLEVLQNFKTPRKMASIPKDPLKNIEFQKDALEHLSSRLSEVENQLIVQEKKDSLFKQQMIKELNIWMDNQLKQLTIAKEMGYDQNGLVKDSSWKVAVVTHKKISKKDQLKIQKWVQEKMGVTPVQMNWK